MGTAPAGTIRRPFCGATEFSICSSMRRLSSKGVLHGQLTGDGLDEAAHDEPWPQFQSATLHEVEG